MHWDVFMFLWLTAVSYPIPISQEPNEQNSRHVHWLFAAMYVWQPIHLEPVVHARYFWDTGLEMGPVGYPELINNILFAFYLLCLSSVDVLLHEMLRCLWTEVVLQWHKNNPQIVLEHTDKVGGGHLFHDVNTGRQSIKTK